MEVQLSGRALAYQGPVFNLYYHRKKRERKEIPYTY
jgi:hypothetical protein